MGCLSTFKDQPCLPLAMAIMFATHRPSLILKVGPRDSPTLVNRVLHLFHAGDTTDAQYIPRPSMIEGRQLPAHKVVLDFTAVFKDKAHDRLCRMYKVCDVSRALFCALYAFVMSE
jgi:hypothetical protein